MATSYVKRKDTLKRKTEELSILCGIKACAIVIGPNGQIDTWPENHSDLNPILESYKNSKNVKEVKVDGNNVKKVKVDGVCLKKNKNVAYDQCLDNMSRESKERLLVKLNSKIETMRKRIEFLKMVNNNVVGDSGSRVQEVALVDSKETHNSFLNMVNNRVDDSTSRVQEVVIVDNKETHNSFWDSVTIDGQQVYFNEIINTGYDQCQEVGIVYNQGQEVGFNELMSTCSFGHEELMFDEMDLLETLNNLENCEYDF